MEQLTGSKLEEYDKAVHCHSAYLTYMHSTSCEMVGWMKHKLQSRFLGEISTTSDDADDMHLRYVDDTTLTAESEERAS